jgi:hypothetical protein
MEGVRHSFSRVEIKLYLESLQLTTLDEKGKHSDAGIQLDITPAFAISDYTSVVLFHILAESKDDVLL